MFDPVITQARNDKNDLERLDVFSFAFVSFRLLRLFYAFITEKYTAEISGRWNFVKRFAKKFSNPHRNLFGKANKSFTQLSCNKNTADRILTFPRT